MKRSVPLYTNEAKDLVELLQRIEDKEKTALIKGLEIDLVKKYGNSMSEVKYIAI